MEYLVSVTVSPLDSSALPLVLTVSSCGSSSCYSHHPPRSLVVLNFIIYFVQIVCSLALQDPLYLGGPPSPPSTSADSLSRTRKTSWMRYLTGPTAAPPPVSNDFVPCKLSYEWPFLSWTSIHRYKYEREKLDTIF